MNICNHLLAAARYPFLTFGGVEVSAVFLLKTAVLLALAMLLLQRARRRTEELLPQISLVRLNSRTYLKKNEAK